MNNIKKYYLKIRPIIVLLPLIHLILFPIIFLYNIINGPILTVLEGAKYILIGIIGSGLPAFIIMFFQKFLDKKILKIKNK